MQNNLSFEALGVLTWARQTGAAQLTVAALQERGCREHTARRILRELRDSGYVTMRRARNARGQLSGTVYDLIPHCVETQFHMEEKFHVEEITHVEENAVTAGNARVHEDAGARQRQKPNTKTNTNTKTKNIAPYGAPSAETSNRISPQAWYDAVKATWGFTGARNGGMAKMLRGEATKAPYRDYNLETPLTNPAQLADWKRWYLNVKQRGKPDAILVSAADKVQSSIGEWQVWQAERARSSMPPEPAYTPPVPVFSEDELRRAASWRQGEVARLKRIQQQIAGAAS